jgi:predicted DNA-binding protein with PD1-like motif
MKRCFLFISLLAAGTCTVLLAQQTRTEVTKSTTPFDDSKPNSSEVPEAYAISGQFERVLVLRFKYETDLLAGFEKMVREQRVRNAVILSGIGSVRGYHLHVVSNRTFPSKNIFVRDPTSPADLIGMNGYVIDGRVHAHMTLAKEDHAFGGHLEPDTTVFTFVVVTLGVLGEDADLRRIDDKTYR